MITPIATLMCANRDPDHLVARDASRQWRWGVFSNDVAQLAATLQRRPERRWLWANDCSYQFAVGLLALLHSGKTIVLPPNAQSGTLATWASQCDATLDATLLTSGNSGHAVDPICFAGLDTHTACIELATSGSTGAAKIVAKTLGNIDSELASHQQLGFIPAHCDLLFSTVSHQHIYGLLFRTLMPLARGIPYWSSSHAYPEHVFADIAHYSQHAALISSPAHLNRLPPALDLGHYATHLDCVFSSGGPLSADAAQQLGNQLGHYPIEILGSTETGGIAWRQQRDSHSRWRALPGVETRSDNDQQLLEVRSPFFTSEQTSGRHDWYLMGDVVALERDGFELKGRADRIVKVEGKRLSLEQMERVLEQHHHIEEARLLLLTENRDCLAAVVILNKSGREQLHAKGKRAMNQLLKDALLPWFERVLLPRKWRYLESMPRNSQDKIPLKDLAALFDTAQRSNNPSVAESPTTQPSAKKFAAVAQKANRLVRKIDDNTLDIAISLDASNFEGHFLNFSILAGVEQIDWAVAHASEWHASNTFSHMEKIKFNRAIPPTNSLHLRLENRGAGRVCFTYTVDGDCASSGHLLFHCTQTGGGER